MTEKDPNDDRVSARLKAWDVPKAPAHLDERVFATYRTGRWKAGGWRRVLNGSVRVPVPVALAACLLFAVTLFAAVRPARVVPETPQSTIHAPEPAEAARPSGDPVQADVAFEAAKEMKVTILDRGHHR